MDLKNWVEPGELGDATIQGQGHLPNTDGRQDVAPAREKDIPENVDTPAPTKPAFDIASLLPLLMSGGGGDMSSVLGNLLKGQKIGGIDVGALLPLVMNSGLFQQNLKSQTPSGKVINLNEYKRIE